MFLPSAPLRVSVAPPPTFAAEFELLLVLLVAFVDAVLLSEPAVDVEPPLTAPPSELVLVDVAVEPLVPALPPTLRPLVVLPPAVDPAPVAPPVPELVPPLEVLAVAMLVSPMPKPTGSVKSTNVVGGVITRATGGTGITGDNEDASAAGPATLPKTAPVVAR